MISETAKVYVATRLAGELIVAMFFRSVAAHGAEHPDELFRCPGGPELWG